MSMKPVFLVLQFFFIIDLFARMASADIELSQLPRFVTAGPTAQSCASSISSRYSASWFCDEIYAASCLCRPDRATSLGLLVDFCITDASTSYQGDTGKYIITSYCWANGYLGSTTSSVIIGEPATQAFDPISGKVF